MRAIQAVDRENLKLADRLADEAASWARSADDDWRLATAACAKAMAARTAADLRELVDRADLLLERVGNVSRATDLHASAAYAALCLGSDADAAEVVDRATPGMRDLDDPHLWMLLRGNAGRAPLLTGDAATALEAFREELELCRELAVLPVAAEGLRGLAAVAAIGGDPERSAWLCSAAETHRYDRLRDPVDERLRTGITVPCRAADVS